MTIAYRVGDSLYLNITNQCSCACTFCIRIEHDGVGSGDNLWLERQPELADVIAAIEAEDLSQYQEAVFCGYGEPTEQLNLMLDVCRYLKKEHPELPLRLNTNGLSDLINKKPCAPLMKGLIDSVSISLNAPDRARYQEIVNSAFGEESFDAMLSFAESCKGNIPQIAFSVVDVIEPGEIERCHSIAAEKGIPLRVRVKS